MKSHHSVNIGKNAIWGVSDWYIKLKGRTVLPQMRSKKLNSMAELNRWVKKYPDAEGYSAQEARRILSSQNVQSVEKIV